MNEMKFIILLFILLINNNDCVKIDWRHVKPLNLMPSSYIHSTLYPDGYGNSGNGPGGGASSGIGIIRSIFGGNNNNKPNSIVQRNINGNIAQQGYHYDNFHRQHGAMKRIFGGNVALHSTFPYQAGLLMKTIRGLNWCGGSIISEDYILTAAHCLDTTLKVLVFLGSYEIKNPNETGAKRIEVPNSHFIIHSGWDPRRLINDIGLIRLPFPIEFSDNIQPIKLPTKAFEAESFAGKSAIASGWGRFSPTSPTISYNLRYVELPIINQGTCLSSFPFLLQSSNICTSGANGRSTCTGDSGGPLVVEDKGTKILIGLTSFGSVFGCDKGYPGVYTRITSYMDWISDITGINYEAKTETEATKNELEKNKNIDSNKKSNGFDDDDDDDDNDDDEDSNSGYGDNFEDDDRKRKRRKTSNIICFNKS